jgi:hypothetical protein
MSYTNDTKPSGSFTNAVGLVREALYGVARYGSSLYGGTYYSNDAEPVSGINSTWADLNTITWAGLNTVTWAELSGNGGYVNDSKPI